MEDLAGVPASYLYAGTNFAAIELNLWMKDVCPSCYSLRSINQYCSLGREIMFNYFDMHVHIYAKKYKELKYKEL